MNKKEIGRVLNDIGVMMELMGENPYRVNAFYSASRQVELLQDDISDLVRQGKIREIRGIGESIGTQISQLVTNGSSSLYEELKVRVPDDLFEMMRIPGLGPKKINSLYTRLGIATVEELEEACRENRLVALSGFGVKTQENILKALANFRKFSGRHRYGDVIDLARELEETLLEQPGVQKVQLAGSLRRCREIVKDIDILASAVDPGSLMEFFTSLPQVENVVGVGNTKASVVLRTGINVDLRVVEHTQFPYALHHFTGSQEHNTAMRHRAKSMGLKMNEYGLFNQEGENIPCTGEKEIFHALGLSFIPPELRENAGEIEAAEQRELPILVDEKDIKGVFHVHTVFSDGLASIGDLVESCRRRGWSYLGIADHSRSAYYAHGLKIDAIERQLREIDALNAEYPDFTIFKGIESDILKDGSLDYPDEILYRFDFVVASIHSGFKMTEAEATNRLLTAMSNPYVTMLGHPTGRILLGREGYPVDLKQIISAAKEYRVILELNANPYRLDLDWRWCRLAKEQGVMIAINPDAHNLENLGYVRFGVGAARKGWLEKENILNTMTREQVAEYLIQLKTVF